MIGAKIPNGSTILAISSLPHQVPNSKKSKENGITKISIPVLKSMSHPLTSSNPPPQAITTTTHPLRQLTKDPRPKTAEMPNSNSSNRNQATTTKPLNLMDSLQRLAEL